MAVGPHVYGDGRIGCWFIFGTNFNDKLKHFVPRVKPLGVTDCFLPSEATLADKKIVTDNGLFAALYETPPHGMSALDYAVRTLQDVDELKVGAAELNIEGIQDFQMKTYIEQVHARIRMVRPSLRLRINCVPWKAQFLPIDLLKNDDQFFLIIQNFIGNMDGRVPEEEIFRDAVDHGIPSHKVSIMRGAHISPSPGKPRVPTLPVQVRYRGSIYNDNLLLDAGYVQ